MSKRTKLWIIFAVSAVGLFYIFRPPVIDVVATIFAVGLYIASLLLLVED